MKVPPNPVNEPSPTLNRREFPERAALGSAALATAPHLAASTASSSRARKNHPQVSAYGKLGSLAPGAVKPAGWLELYLQKQANALGSQLPTVSWPFTESYWAGQEAIDKYQWWPWEQKG